MFKAAAAIASFSVLVSCTSGYSVYEAALERQRQAVEAGNQPDIATNEAPTTVTDLMSQIQVTPSAAPVASPAQAPVPAVTRPTPRPAPKPVQVAIADVERAQLRPERVQVAETAEAEPAPATPKPAEAKPTAPVEKPAEDTEALVQPAPRSDDIPIYTGEPEAEPRPEPKPEPVTPPKVTRPDPRPEPEPAPRFTATNRIPNTGFVVKAGPFETDARTEAARRALIRLGYTPDNELQKRPEDTVLILRIAAFNSRLEATNFIYDLQDAEIDWAFIEDMNANR